MKKTEKERQAKPDAYLEKAVAQIRAVRDGKIAAPHIEAFFDEETFAASYIVHDPASKNAAIIDSVLDFDPASGRIATRSAEAIANHVHAKGLKVVWLLETHVHADHLSAAAWLQQKLGGTLAIGAGIKQVQQFFGAIFNEDAGFARDGSQFDRLLEDGDELILDSIPLIALHVPGHTPVDMAFIIGDAVFTGDTIFMPDYGSARTDFPGGDARQLYHSVRRLMRLPGDTRVFLCHDYKAPGRGSYVWQTTMREERETNIHIHQGISEDDFVAMRQRRDATLAMPRLLLPAIQVNMRGGRLPEPEDNGVSYLKLPLNRF